MFNLTWAGKAKSTFRRMGRISRTYLFFVRGIWLFMPTVQWLDPLYFVYSPFGKSFLGFEVPQTFALYLPDRACSQKRFDSAVV